LNLTPEQRERFETMHLKRAEQVLEHLTSGERFAAVNRKVHESNAEHIEWVDRLLTEPQREKLKAMLGEPFKGEIQLNEPRSIRFEKRTSVYLGKLFNRYALEPDFMLQASIQRELRMDDDQVRKAREFHVEWSEKIEKGRQAKDDPVDTLESLHDLVKENLPKILTLIQQGRFMAIMMQHRAKVAGDTAAIGRPEVFEALQISATQRKRMLEEREPIKTVLSTSERKLFDRLMNPPFQGEIALKNNPLIVDRRGASSEPKPVVPVVLENTGTFAAYLIDKAQRYKLTDDQIARLKEIDVDTPRLKNLLHKELSNLPRPTDASAVRAVFPESQAVQTYRKAIIQQCFDALDDKQRSLFGKELKRVSDGY
jgi:hypothetical protein